MRKCARFQGFVLDRYVKQWTSIHEKMQSAGKKLLNAGEKVLTRVEKVSGACSPVWRITYLQALCHHPDRSGGNFIGIPDLNVGSSSPQVFLYCLFLLAKVK